MGAHGSVFDGLSLVDDLLCVPPGIIGQVFEGIRAPEDQVQILISSVQIVPCVGVGGDEVIFPVGVSVDIRIGAMADDRRGIGRFLYQSIQSVPRDLSGLPHSVGVEDDDLLRESGAGGRDRDVLYSG